MDAQTLSVTTGELGPVPVTLTDRGEGRPFLLLHGGAGPQSVAGFADLLASQGARVLVPVHPGFGGTPRPGALRSIRGLALLYTRMLDELGLTGVTVLGNSIGGWIAAEMAVRASSQVSGVSAVSAVVLVNAAGLQLDDHPAADFFALTPDQITDLAYYRPDRFRIDLSTLSGEQKAIAAANRAALEVYGGRAMADPALSGSLASVTLPVLVVWGEADRLFPVEHGEAYAKAIPGARLAVIEEAGHLPQLEAPERLLAAIADFAGSAA